MGIERNDDEAQSEYISTFHFIFYCFSLIYKATELSVRTGMAVQLARWTRRLWGALCCNYLIFILASRNVISSTAVAGSQRRGSSVAQQCNPDMMACTVVVYHCQVRGSLIWKYIQGYQLQMTCQWILLWKLGVDCHV